MPSRRDHFPETPARVGQSCRKQCVGVDCGGAEQGQLGFGRSVQDRAGTPALRDDQLLAFLMHDVDDRAVQIVADPL